MKPFPAPALVAATAALAALPFSIAAAGTLLLTAALGTIIHADYTLRHRLLPLPRRSRVACEPAFRAALRGEDHRLAA